MSRALVPRPTTALQRAVVASSALALAATLLPGAAQAAPTTSSDAYTAAIQWTSCGAELPAFQCASVAVPLDYDHPRGKTISLALTRLPAAEPSQRIGSLFTNPGGPGGSGVSFVQNGAQLFYSQQVRNRFDIIGFDPRGVAGSTPVTCYDSAEQEQQALASSIGFPITAAQIAQYDREARALARNCAQRSAELIRHSSTANVARDMDVLRRAVGDAKLNYAGYSYGTYLGATYAALFPNRIRAMVLDGTIDPREYSGTRKSNLPLGNRIEQDRGGAEVFAEFLKQCRLAGPGRCSMAALGDPKQVSDGVFAALRRAPIELQIPDGGTVTVTYQVMVSASYSSLYSPTAWADLADTFTALAQSAGGRSEARRLPAGAAALLNADREEYDSVGGAFASPCVDTAVPPARAFPAAAWRSEARYLYFGSYRTWTTYACVYLRLRDNDAYTGPWRQRTKTPVLVMGTRHDPSTPYRNTRPYASLFRAASVVTLEGWGHTMLGQSSCADAQVTSYLLDPDARRRDVRCASDLQPFSAASQASTRAEARASSLP